MTLGRSVFYCIALLISVALTGLWLDRHIVIDNFTGALLLLALFTAVIIDILLGLIREVDFRINRDLPRAFIPYVYLLACFSKLIVIAILLFLAAWLNVWILATLIGLIPVEIYYCQLLHRELSRRSQFILDKHLGWKEALAASVIAVPAEPRILSLLRTCRSTLNIYKNTENGIKVVQAVSLIGKAGIVLLALYDILFRDFVPMKIVLYSAMFPLFFYCLNHVIYGSIGKQDLEASILFLTQVEDRLRSPE